MGDVVQGGISCHLRGVYGISWLVWHRRLSRYIYRCSTHPVGVMFCPQVGMTVRTVEGSLLKTTPEVKAGHPSEQKLNRV